MTLVLAVFIFGGVNLAYESLQSSIYETEENYYKETEKKPEYIDIIDFDQEIENLLRKQFNLQEEIWQIEIPAIGLEAPIAEGTTQEVMRDYVGHFENTNLWKGNIGLAAHNRRISNKLF